MNSQIAKGLMEMNASRRGGVLYSDYLKKPAIIDSKTKLKDSPEFCIRL